VVGYKRSVAILSLVVVALLAPSCKSGKGSGPSSTALKVGPAWQAVLDQVRPDGTVTAQTALQAFSVAIAPLPGVSVPPGEAGQIPSGTVALRWLVSHWKEISSQQRDAAAVAVPELKAVRLTNGGVAAVINVPADLRRAAPKRSDFFYTQMAEQTAKDIGAKVGLTLGIPITAKVGQPQQGTSAAETGVYNSSGGLSGTPGKCVITVSPAGDAYLGDDVGAVIAHEVWHCFEGVIGGLGLYWSPTTPAWITEGEAEWVGASMYPNAPINSMFWPNYLNAPEVSLFQRSYTAIGFYSQLGSAGTDVWSKLAPIIQAKNSVAAFVAAGATQDAFLDRWSSGYARDALRGAPWDIVGPGVTSDRAKGNALPVADGASAPVSAAAYTNSVYEISDDSAEVLLIAVAGHARVSDATIKDYLVQGAGAFCHRVNGCTCPNQASDESPMLALPGPDIVLAVTGGPNGANGTVEGMSLQTYCSRGITGTWSGTWLNDNGLAVGAGTVVLVQKGTAVTGTASVSGKTCVRKGTIIGTVTGSTIHIVLNAERAVTMDGHISGKTMSGTFSAPSCGPPYGPPNITVTVTGTWHASKIK
jgi:hypothetical protein